MTLYRLKIAESDFTEIQNLVLADMPKEAGAFALAGMATHKGSTDILVRRVISIPKEHVSLQHEYQLEVSSQAVNGLIALCEANRLGAVICHSHPEDIPYSLSDDKGERRIVEVLRQFIPPQAPTASLLFFPGGIRGRVWSPHSLEPIPISEILLIGRHVRRINPGAGPSHAYNRNEEKGAFSDISDREVRAFGNEGMALIRRARVGIVGVGGTGSPTAEQVVRLTTRDVILIDPDIFEPPNLTRVYGTFASSIPRSSKSRKEPPRKVDLIARHLHRINPNARIQPISKNVVLKEAATALLDRDIIFLCTDDHWGRSIVNEIAYQYLVPTINLGVRLSAEDAKISQAVGVVDILRPDKPCLWCSQFLQAKRIAAESMPRSKREPLAHEGYVEGLDTLTPSVVSVTTTVSGLAVAFFLELLTDFMGSTGDVARLNYNMMDSTVRRGQPSTASPCVCTKVRGFGDLRPLSTVESLAFLDE